MNITGFEHVGIRVSDRAEALKFYEVLGFVEDAYFPDYPANEMTTASGVRINLIFNGVRREAGANILFEDEPTAPGTTHPAFIVDNLNKVIEMCDKNKLKITEGPLEIDARRRALFIRDPDGNVIEFDEIL
ncbi:MAG: VOC family protein [Gammaproteobacteria bacterium]